MQKFPLRMKDNDLLVTELYRDPTNDQITSISVYLTPKTTSEYSNAFDSFAFETNQNRIQSKINLKILSKSSSKKLNPINACQHQMDEKVKEKLILVSFSLFRFWFIQTLKFDLNDIRLFELASISINFRTGL